MNSRSRSATRDRAARATGSPRMACPVRWLALIGFGRGAGLFEPDEDGFRAFIFPVTDRLAVHFKDASGAIVPRDAGGVSTALIDLAAWRPSMPADVLLRRGVVAALGEYAINPVLAGDEPLRLWESPLAWASAEFAGSVVLDWGAVAPRLLEWREIVCDTLDLGERLEAELGKARRRYRAPPMPKIAVSAEAFE